MSPKFLIIRFSSIGDIIQCMDVINGIKNHYPEAEIHWITRKDMSTFLSMDKRIDKIWAFDKKEGFKGLLQIANELKKEHFDYIYDAHSNIRSYVLSLKLVSVCKTKPYFIRRSKERLKRLLLFRLRINHFPRPFRGVVSFRKPLQKWGITDFHSTYTDWIFAPEYDRYKQLIHPNTVTLVPSANWPMKRWPVAHWQQLVTLLSEYQFVLLAGPDDSFCEEIRKVAPDRIVNLAGKTSLKESCYIVYQSHLIVSADTGFMHAADLFRKKAYALIGPTAFGFPTGNSVEVLEVDLPCRPCTKDGRGKCKRPIYQECMVKITPEKLADKIKKRLSLF